MGAMTDTLEAGHDCLIAAMSGSAIKASPIQLGATTRMRFCTAAPLIAGDLSVSVDNRTWFETVFGAAVRAHRNAGLGDVEKHSRMMIPDRHGRIGTKGRQIGRAERHVQRLTGWIVHIRS
jgi:hypothetical protein